MKKLIAVILVCVLLASSLSGCGLIGLLAIMGASDSDSEQELAVNPGNNVAVQDPESENHPSNTEQQEPEIKIYKAGMYKVGSDIEAGEYFVTANKGKRCYIEVANNSSGTLDSIVSNDNTYTFIFVTVSDGQYLTVTRGTFVKALDATVPGPDNNGEYHEGMYRVGIDIPAGEYLVTPEDGKSCYIEVAKDSIGNLHSIITNDNTRDPKYISVKDNQYITIERGTLKPA